MPYKYLSPGEDGNGGSEEIYTGAVREVMEETGNAIMHLRCIGCLESRYDDMQTQNQHLLQQITERDDYNIKGGADVALRWKIISHLSVVVACLTMVTGRRGWTDLG
uniref:DOMON domain-containing protein n=1 Tax=Salix viminalis TaxID=40686 RepID=A0A6N2MCV5_SALVM